MIKRVYKPRQKAYFWGFDKRVPTAGGGSKRVRIFEFSTREEAEEALGLLNAKIRQSAHGLTPSRAPLLIDLIRARVETITARVELAREKRVLVEWLAILDPSIDSSERILGRIKSPVRVVDADTPSIQRYADKRRSQGQSAASIKRELTVIAATLHKAADWFPELAQWRPPKVPYPKVTNSRRERVITQAEYQALLRCLRRKAGPLDANYAQNQRNAYEARLRVAQIFQTAMLTAMRHSEIVGLEWSAVEWENERLVIRQSKTGRYKQIPITPPLAKILRERERKGDTGKYVFTQNGKIYPKFYRILREACALCGIPYGKYVKNGIVLHTARHTVTTQLILSGSDLDTTGLITGHSAKYLIAHYTHHSPASLKRAAEALARTGTEEPTS